MSYKMFRRSAANKVIAGVCGGLGEYFSIDPVLVRVIFIAASFAGGLGIVLYLSLCLLTS